MTSVPAQVTRVAARGRRIGSDRIQLVAELVLVQHLDGRGVLRNADRELSRRPLKEGHRLIPEAEAFEVALERRLAALSDGINVSLGLFSPLAAPFIQLFRGDAPFDFDALKGCSILDARAGTAVDGCCLCALELLAGKPAVTGIPTVIFLAFSEAAAASALRRSSSSWLGRTGSRATLSAWATRSACSMRGSDRMLGLPLALIYKAFRQSQRLQ